MKTVAIIQARMGSSRLPNKVLMPVLGRPLLGWMIERISSCEEIDEIVIATTTESRDDRIVEFADSIGCKVYRGSEEDVLDRYYQAASSVQAGVVVRITADCPLLDPIILGGMIRHFAHGNLDFLSNSEPLPSSWPDGMDISIITFKALEKAWVEAVKPSDREHVTFYFWNNPMYFRCERIDHDPDLSKYRITIDYQEDFELLNKVIKYFIESNNKKSIKDFGMDKIISFLDENPAVFDLNKKYIRGLGWESSFRRDEELGF